MEGVGKTACRCDSCLESCFERDRNVETHIHIYIYIYICIYTNKCVCVLHFCVSLGRGH